MVAVLATGVVLGAVWLRVGPLPAGLLEDRVIPSTTVVDRNGVVLYEARSSRGERSGWMLPQEIPAALARATVAAEDHRFWSHPGIDPLAMARAVGRDVRAGRIVQGASTITQQVAKLLLARRSGQTQGWRAKAYEGVVAIRLEHRMSKREILALYLSLAPYGNQITGAERASRAYFGRSARSLTVAQASFLASLPQRPSTFNPWRDSQRARERQQWILRRMRRLGWITETDAQVAQRERVSPVRAGGETLAPHFVQMVLASAGETRRTRGVRIDTTLDAALQRSIHGIIEARRSDLHAHGAGHVAVVVLHNRTGEWLAWEGSGAYFDPEGGAIDGARSPRQPGSALKPFTYALAFDNGYSPASVLPDVPSHFPTSDAGVFYSPRNYDGRYRGPLLARAALAGSENVPAVALVARLGPPSLLRLLRRAGMTTLTRSAAYYGLGLTLGNAEVRLDELVSAYSALARGGLSVRPVFLKRHRPLPDERLLSSRAAYWVTDILSDPDAREYTFGRGGSLEFPFPVAAKTGTSQAYHDNWAIGYTREVTAGVWAGNFDRTPLRNSSGVTGAGPIFHAVMLAAMERYGSASASAAGPHAFDIVPAPSGAASLNICQLSGMQAHPWCPRQARESVPAENDSPPCSWHRNSHDGPVTVWPPEYRAWASDRGILSRVVAPVVRTSASGSPASSGTHKRFVVGRRAAVEITNPPPGAIYLIDPTLRREFQTLPLRAVGGDGALTWTIDGRLVGTTASESALDWPLAVGQHDVAVADSRGRRATTTVVVR